MSGYATLRVKLVHFTADAALLSVGESVARGAWVPRRAIHIEDRPLLIPANKGQMFTMRVDRAMADEKGLTSELADDGRSGDLFEGN